MELGLGRLNDEEKDKETDSMYTLGQNRQDLGQNRHGSVWEMSVREGGVNDYKISNLYKTIKGKKLLMPPSFLSMQYAWKRWFWLRKTKLNCE